MKQSKAEIDKMNAESGPELQASWELETAMRRMAFRGVGGPKAQYRMAQENWAIVRAKAQGSIDWWQYQQVFLKLKHGQMWTLMYVALVSKQAE
jgi:hypothetical protein